MRYHCDYQPNLLGSAPQVLHIGPWRLHYLAFARHATDTRPPVLLLAGKGHEDYQEIAGVKLPFSDLEQGRLALQAWRLRQTKEQA